jgi:hypothetical protein
MTSFSIACGQQDANSYDVAVKGRFLTWHEILIWKDWLLREKPDSEQ